MIQTLRERYQQSSDIESDLEAENEIEEFVIDSRKELQAKNTCQKKLKHVDDKSLKKIHDFPNHSNFDDTG